MRLRVLSMLQPSGKVMRMFSFFPSLSSVIAFQRLLRLVKTYVPGLSSRSAPLSLARRRKVVAFLMIPASASFLPIVAALSPLLILTTLSTLSCVPKSSKIAVAPTIKRRQIRKRAIKPGRFLTLRPRFADSFSRSALLPWRPRACVLLASFCPSS